MEKDLFIRALSIDWNEVEKDSCLRHIPALLFHVIFPHCFFNGFFHGFVI